MLKGKFLKHLHWSFDICCRVVSFSVKMETGDQLLNCFPSKIQMSSPKIVWTRCQDLQLSNNHVKPYWVFWGICVYLLGYTCVFYCPYYVSILWAWVSTDATGAWHPSKFWTSPPTPADFEVLNNNWHPQPSLELHMYVLSKELNHFGVITGLFKHIGALCFE